MTVGYSEWTGVMTYIESKYITKYMDSKTLGTLTHPNALYPTAICRQMWSIIHM